LPSSARAIGQLVTGQDRVIAPENRVAQRAHDSDYDSRAPDHNSDTQGLSSWPLESRPHLARIVPA